MNSLNRIVRALVWGVLVSWAIWLLRRWILPAMHTEPAKVPVQRSASPISLHRDPVCGMHVSPEISVKIENEGRTTHFCSAECRDRYLRPERSAVNA